MNKEINQKRQSPNKEINKKRQFLNREFKQKGRIALKYRNECIGMLPEIYKLRAYEKENCSSIYEYAAKFAGISHAQVDDVLRLERRLDDKPALKKALISGNASHHKIARVISIATKENEGELAKIVQTHSRVALDILVKEAKNDQKVLDVQNIQNTQETLPDINILEQLSIELQKDLIERHKKGININELLQKLLKKHDQEVETEMEKIGENAQQTKSKYIKVRIQKVLKQKHGTKCSVPRCEKEAQNLHHKNYFSISRVHDPRYIAPMCKGHHEIAHSKNSYYMKMRQNCVGVPGFAQNPVFH